MVHAHMMQLSRQKIWSIVNASGPQPKILEMWETIEMPQQRNLRVVKWIGTVPAVGVCTFCDRTFAVPLSAMKRVADAQENLRVKFAEHQCKRQET
jgi:hypothetical protein